MSGAFRVEGWGGTVTAGSGRASEDCILVGGFSMGDGTERCEFRLFLLSDGMGRKDCPRLASALCIETIAGALFKSAASALYSERVMERRIFRERSPAYLLEEAIRAANRRLFYEGERSGSRMGATIVGLLFHGSGVVLVHAGDSRCYRFAEGRLDALTVDDRGGRGASPDLTMAVGLGETIVPHIGEYELERGQVWLLCSDGLYEVVDEKCMTGILEGVSGREAVGALLEAARDSGVEDDASVVVVRVS